ncbi:Signal transducer regulating beta-lactamase production, contains metallopeptidase domain [Georgenia satyanarayanai]|uniref:Signal transducer regulating beta-lactamase production, contains metallopeptidase domain n=1 Tax=Georgenia satyanarayanai TaxID=860221 RepID=A0A2Y8ZWF2_9MICO|nr:M56 family metallopeptidase [Georgenia satyanarayanai]PYG01614.1 beta-lactamase regulating signal transducer with metallopeptidase domain [Georgenia satyanarayanai]SSA36414.1 Signal transducer regulating beta-lactamase production, contains metallopeptidase domain [Georgenia satyanarayanai]
MTGLVAVAGLVTLLAVGATAGPWALARLAPALARRPRAGITAWTAGAVLWVLGLLALGPLVGWVAGGPGLPGPAGAVCRRCLEASNPFVAATAVDVPPAVPLLAAALLGLALLAVLGATARRRRREVRAHVAALAATARRSTVGGERVWLVPTVEPAAYTLPRAGVVLSSGTVDALDHEQLGAVLAHERAHLDGRHHLVLAVLGGLQAVLGWVPLLRHARDAVAAYAEMAADDAALRAHGSRALAGALLALHRPGVAAGVALHAGAVQVPSRIARLAGGTVAPDRLAGALVACYLLVAAAAVTLVTVPYAATILQGAC